MTSSASAPPEDLPLEKAAEALSTTNSALSWHQAEREVSERCNLPPLLTTTGARNEEAGAVRLALLWLLSYRIEVSSKNGKMRVVVEPDFRTSSGVQAPPNLSEVGDEVIAVWKELSTLTSAPFATARINHLLYERGGQERRERALLAIDAYLDSASGWERGLDRVYDLERALRLSRAVHDEARTDRSIRELLDNAFASLRSVEPTPGLALAYLDPVLGEPRAEASIVLAFLLEAQETFADNTNMSDSILRIRTARENDPTGRIKLYEQRVDLWLDAAERAHGVLRAAWRKRALEVASESGFRALERKAAAALQATDRSELQLARSSSSLGIDREEVEQVMSPIREQDSWQGSLAAFSLFGPITGDPEVNRESARESNRLAPLQAILPRELLGGDGLPRYRADSDEARFALAVADHERSYIELYAPWLAEALLAVSERHGIPSEDDLNDYYSQTDWMDEDDRRGLARCLTRFWVGDYEGCAYSTAPKIESFARKLVIRLDVGVYRLQRDQRPGQYPGLRVLLDVLKEKGLPDSWYRFLRTLCVGPEGMNLRNELLHGFVPDVSRAGAVLLLQAACFLAQIEPSTSSEENP